MRGKTEGTVDDIHLRREVYKTKESKWVFWFKKLGIDSNGFV